MASSLVCASHKFHISSISEIERSKCVAQGRGCRQFTTRRRDSLKGIVSCSLAERDGGRKVIVIGGGVGGLAVGGKLAFEGFDVQILEKNADSGGRLQSLYAKLGGQETFRFDTGPSLLLLPQKYRDAFTAMGEKLEDYVVLEKVDPVAYRVFFGEEEGPHHLDLMYDVQKMCAQLESVEKGAAANFLRFLSNAKEALDKGTESFIERDFRTFWDYANIPRLLPLLRHLSPFELLGQHHARMKNYFSNPKLQALFTFQDLYVGLTPYNAPGVFSLLAATEITDGVWYPLGGFGKVRDALVQAAQKAGVKIQTKTTVKRIEHMNGKVIGVTLEDGSILRADIVVANADLPYVYNQLLSSGGNKHAERLTRSKYSASVISFNWSLDSHLDGLNHHNIFLSESYERSWDRATDASSFLDQPNFYLHAPSRTDPSVCPTGTDAITVLLPVAHFGEGYNKGHAGDDKAIVDVAREKIFDRLKKSGIGDIFPHILSEVVYSPPTWKDSYNLQHGATFGLSHNLLQLAYFRPDIADYSIRGLYFTGASTRPGNGVPLVLMGAKLTSNRILEDCKDLLI
ncbi:unnamed protein product [Calypogeia fissa]